MVIGNLQRANLRLCDRMYITCATAYNICMFESKSTNIAQSSVIFFKQFWQRKKTYRAALHTFWIIILNALTPLMNQLLPVSLVPRAQLNENLTIIHLQQNGLEDRIPPAVPIQEMLSYYETKLVTQVEARGLF